ncbi:hypothetical protein [Delftia sp. PS-11]|uniref:hypothetical protein n=1 Tax=Delftia sp. PS-11 TaxID=2767222 RepID=UPI002453BD24|nr:hypothetical protein [Delftia sp. PS-11]KAJ8745701.1 hypothetical protein H9T68_05610 [Delftia sp. PS-11]
MERRINIHTPLGDQLHFRELRGQEIVSGNHDSDLLREQLDIKQHLTEHRTPATNRIGDIFSSLITYITKCIASKSRKNRVRN